GARHLDALRVRRRVEDSLGAVPLDRRHVWSPCDWMWIAIAFLRQRWPGRQPFGTNRRRGLIMDEALREITKKTARMLFHSMKGGVGFETWKKFDKDLARELSMFFTGKLYSRE